MKSVRTAIATACIAGATSAVPNPFGDGPLLDPWPTLPPALLAQADDADPASPPTEEPAPVAAQPVALPPAPTESAGERPPSPLALALGAMFPDGVPAPAALMESSCSVTALERCVRPPLARTFAGLDAVVTGESRRVRIAWFGDSLVMGDLLTGGVRDSLQARFGDAGHGFLFVGTPGNRAGARGIRTRFSDEWDYTTVVHTVSRGQTLGIGGVAFEVPAGTAPTLWVATEDPAALTRVGVLALPERGARSFDVRDANGRREIAVETEPNVGGATFFDVASEGGVSLSGFSSATRWHGVSLENDRPGVIVDNIGLVSAEVSDMLKIDQASWSAEVDALDPDLLVFQYGANAAWEGTSTAAAARLREHSSDWLARVRQDHPDRDCLVIGMLTRGDWVDGRATVRDSVPDVVAVQRETALAAGCAFWSAFDAAGGVEGLERWRRDGLIGGDLSHPTRSGYEALAAAIDDALLYAWVSSQAVEP